MKLISGSLKKRLAKIKDNNPYLRLLWLYQLATKRKKSVQKSDIQAVKDMYYPRAQRYPDLDNPKAFTEKLQWLKLYYRNDLMPIVADKYEVRSYLEKKGYSYLLNDLYEVFYKIDAFKPERLPHQFVLKAAHASGWNLIVKDKSKINWWIWKKHMKYWLTHDIAWRGREWHYADMTPKIVCEKYLEDESGGLTDYKCFCFNGEPKFIYVHVKGNNGNYLNFYDTEWNLLPFTGYYKPGPDHKIDRPKFLDEILKISKDLSTPFPFVRIDFYIENGNLRFGEFTFFPGGGGAYIRPIEWDYKIGEWLTLPEPNHKID